MGQMAISLTKSEEQPVATNDRDRANQKPENTEETAQWEERAKDNTQAQTNEDPEETGRWEDSKD
jgi:hypothetical protein